jgi:pimeloyl-ACP methyl ester carboxylesterase
MSYDSKRCDAQLAAFDQPIRDFITRYNANTSTKRQTVFLFPGGMGSRLIRANTAYPAPPSYYNTTWLDCSILLDAATEMQMQGNYDYQKHIVVADSTVDFMTLRPYHGFTQWCDTHGLDWFVLSWDWRRHLEETVDFFLQTFLPHFKARVQAGCNANPLNDFTLIGHSFGGMVVKLILNRATNSYVQALTRAITVGSPFYGYGGQLARYFKGDPDLNFKGISHITRVVSSLPAGYQLLFLDEATFALYGNALAQDPQYPLSGYPVTDAVSGAPADPYVQATQGQLVRYSSKYGFVPGELGAAKAGCQTIAAPLPAAINSKFFMLRNVQFRNGTARAKTVNRQTWRFIPKSFDPETDASPVTDILGPGDGVVPAWSARLVTAPAANVRTLHEDIEHMDLMDEQPVLKVLGSILGLITTRRARRKDRDMPRIDPSRPQAARRKALADFTAKLKKIHDTPGISKEQEKQAIRKLLRSSDREELVQLMTRAFLDAPKSPAQKLGEARRPVPKARPVAPKPTRMVRQRRKKKKK